MLPNPYSKEIRCRKNIRCGAKKQYSAQVKCELRRSFQNTKPSIYNPKRGIYQPSLDMVFRCTSPDVSATESTTFRFKFVPLFRKHC